MPVFKKVNISPAAEKAAARYRFLPKVNAIARSEEAVRETARDKKIMKDVLKGNSYEDIADAYGISTNEAYKISKEFMARWAGPLGHTATEAKELDLKRLDALLVTLHPMVFPEEELVYPPGMTTPITVMPKPDLAACRLMLDIIDRRSKIIGTEAAHKLEEEKKEILQRMYIGVTTNRLGEVDI